MLSETEQQPLATAIALSAIATGLRSVRSAPCPNRFSDDAAFQRITLVGSELEQSPSVRRENMPPSVHRSTAEKFLIVVSCVLCFCLPTPSLAQRPIAVPLGEWFTHQPRRSPTLRFFERRLFTHRFPPLERPASHSACLGFSLGVRFADFRQYSSFTNHLLFWADLSGHGTHVRGRVVICSGLGRSITPRSPPPAR